MIGVPILNHPASMSNTAEKKGADNVIALTGLRQVAEAIQTRVGALVAFDERGPVVDYLGNPGGPRGARTLVPLTAERARALIDGAVPVVLGFEDGRAELPIILGVVWSTTIDEQRRNAAAPAELTEAPPEPVRALVAQVDGEEVTIVGRRRIELRCGKASIILTRAGKVIVRGTHLVSHSSGANRIRGGSVELN